ncbi:MAG: hypothetical protein A2901_00275 [Elusimicrobia bacterium RIFCSPLOWO2_01_FULL_54_10]|nr:MAG: hypothetical protein A2901_00275 [Elusimicrobia bacterium RIFCSPLOWO2_01_FULL_54_10]
MGTLLQISVEAESREEAQQAVDDAFKEARRWDELLSNYKENSEISRLNREAYPESAQAPVEVVRFLQAAQGLSRETSGYFEIMIEPLTKIWGLRERKLVKMPLKKHSEAARFKSNHQHLEIYDKDNTVRFIAEGMGIDTGGIGKGYALDRALEKIRSRKVSSAVLNFGGEILYWPMDGLERKISIKNPLEPDRIWKAFSIAGFPSETSAVSTSANYERFITVEKGGKEIKMSHILDSRTGKPVDNGIRSVTVASANAARADALSTALYVMGLEKAKAFAAAHPEDWTLILYQEFGGPLKSFSSGGWKVSDHD